MIITLSFDGNTLEQPPRREPKADKKSTGSTPVETMKKSDIALPGTVETAVGARCEVSIIASLATKFFIYSCLAAGIFVTLVWIGAWCWLLIRALLSLL